MTGNVADINLQTPVGTNVACGSGTASFGSVDVGSSSTQTIRIQNVGTGPLILTGLPLSISGANANQYNIVTQPTSPIAAGGFSDMVVQFSPTSNGTKTASISIANYDPDENPCVINLSGTGVSPDINLQTPVGTNVACGGSTSYGSVTLGSSTTKTIRIQNLGTSPLNLTGLPLSVSGTNADQFSIVTQPTSPIAVGGFSDMVVQFSPTSNGAKTASISIANNDPDENPCVINLSGTGVSPDINLQTPVGTNVACGGSTAYGNVNVGSSTTKTIRIQNLGTSALNLTGLPLSISGANADQFSIVTQPTSPIAAGGFSDMVVQFSPTNSGAQTATISIASNDPDE
ncbi:MAG: choice-of-anchor D domain-containing protein, partial [Bacteroidetes bacterium]|nr:choice-of-anchor D domain-containing protein [Bacteroidota bacterium]